MPRSSAQLNSCPVLIKVVGATVALALHLAVVGAIFSSSSAKPKIELPETVEVRFIEIADDPVDAAANIEADLAPVQEVAQTLPESEVIPDPVVESELVAEPELEPVVEPELPKPEPVIKQVIKPAPKPMIKAPVKPQPQAHVAAAPVGQASAPVVPKAPAGPVDPDRARLISKVDYLGKRPNPVYPRASERRGEKGRVVVRVLISPQGTVADVSVRSSSGYSRLDEAALTAARTARFKPYMENGIAYQAMADIPFDFVL